MRTDFHLPDDDAEDAVKVALQDDDFRFDERDWNAWWIRSGHKEVRRRARSIYIFSMDGEGAPRDHTLTETLRCGLARATRR